MTGSEFRPQLRLLLVQAPRSPGYPAWQPLSQLDLHHLSSCGTLRDPCSPRPPPVLVPGLPLELGVRLPKVPLYLSLSSLPPPWLKLKPQPLRGPPSPSDRPFACPTSSLASSLPLHVHRLWPRSSESTPGCPLQLLHCGALCSECFPSGFPHGSRLSSSSGGPP